MQYVKIYWLNPEDDSAEIQFSELDDGRFERRKIEIYPDGSFGIADSTFNFGGTALSVEPLPQPDGLDDKSRPVAEILSQKEFEDVWYKYYNFLSS
ncbi:hypothetical protein [Chitinophaga sp. sic0106]|uniref:DUF6881 domain-containing protein n=1 Tax=Chitinophaga sp. sic0106 TaxID=2854785 RepID=UPI001C485A8F|nr:hypothetical protein [Chitinophaga sp. sic0106]MBV7530557.1 hypothetical protein [Chitinophaga sp. sic0106]